MMVHSRRTTCRLALVLALFCGCAAEEVEAIEPAITPDAQRAFGYLEQICALGPRCSGSEGMLKQQELITSHFTKLGGKIQFQDFDAPHPQTGQPVRLKNIIVSWHPEATERVLICCHYDTRPKPDREPIPANREKPFLGANDGASGVALLMELGHYMPGLKTTYGVDFIFFDAEELVYTTTGDAFIGTFFLGSEKFSREYIQNPPSHRYLAGVLVDMVGDKQLNLHYEANSLRLAPAVTRSVWETARKVGVKEFIPRRKYELRDDHLPLNQIAKIPTCDIIDFDYPYWHLRNDIPAACSGESLAKVGKVVLAWLQTYKP
jgi:hypothetical protein